MSITEAIATHWPLLIVAVLGTAFAVFMFLAMRRDIRNEQHYEAEQPLITQDHTPQHHETGTQ